MARNSIELNKEIGLSVNIILPNCDLKLRPSDKTEPSCN
jgi:hypothetical protein